VTCGACACSARFKPSECLILDAGITVNEVATSSSDSLTVRVDLNAKPNGGVDLFELAKIVGEALCNPAAETSGTAPMYGSLASPIS
jgi:hypothetical protein